MASKETGGSAFPVSENAARAWAVFEHTKKPMSDAEYMALIEKLQAGMTLRDYFAAKAMQGQIAGVGGLCQTDAEIGEVAAMAYAMADAMLKAREA